MKLSRFRVILSEHGPILIIIAVVIVFFGKFFFQGLLPIPADTIVGLYHPWRDVTWNGYTAGVPFKNFLITDPVRQLYPWRELAIDLLKKRQWPMWNPYSFSGTPLLANIQSAPYYPLNLIFFLTPFWLAWSILVIVEPLLAGIFTYAYLKKMRLSPEAAGFGALVFLLSGFSLAWLTWNTVGQTILWLPLILLAIENAFSEQPKRRWFVILVFAFSALIFAGHWQTAAYALGFTLVYFLARTWVELRRQARKKFVLSSLFILLALCISILITSVAWLPALRFISLSNRTIDQSQWQQGDWFIPWQHLSQFVAPDFFGNPATLNYWGVWNYGEFVGYVGIVPLIFVIYALIKRRDDLTHGFALLLVVLFLFALPTTLAKLPYYYNIPFLSTVQPTRLLSLIDFLLAVIAALGFDTFMSPANATSRRNRKHMVLACLSVGAVLFGLWLYTSVGEFSLHDRSQNLLIARKNLVIPSVVFILGSLVLLGQFSAPKKPVVWRKISIFVVFLMYLLDMLRFGWKFTPFVDRNWLFPTTKIIDYLASQPDPIRFMTTDSRVFPPNFSVAYRLQSVDGYDPLYLRSYAQFIGMWVRNSPDISPIIFKRILTPHDYQSPLAKIANVGFVLTLTDESSPDLEFVMAEGKTNLYKLRQALPRAYFARTVEEKTTIEDLAQGLFDPLVASGAKALVEERIEDIEPSLENQNDSLSITTYSANEIRLQTKTQSRRFLVLSDVYYPSWKAYLDDEEIKIYRTNFTFRGLIVPAGEHSVRFTIGPFL